MGAAPRECCVYVLHLKDHSFFAGYTRDMKVRLMKHQDGTIHPTAGCTPRPGWFTVVESRTEA